MKLALINTYINEHWTWKQRTMQIILDHAEVIYSNSVTDCLRTRVNKELWRLAVSLNLCLQEFFKRKVVEFAQAKQLLKTNTFATPTHLYEKNNRQCSKNTRTRSWGMNNSVTLLWLGLHAFEMLTFEINAFLVIVGTGMLMCIQVWHCRIFQAISTGMYCVYECIPFPTVVSGA